jgi:hypothetical protein
MVAGEPAECTVQLDHTLGDQLRWWARYEAYDFSVLSATPTRLHSATAVDPSSTVNSPSICWGRALTPEPDFCSTKMGDSVDAGALSTSRRRAGRE